MESEKQFLGVYFERLKVIGDPAAIVVTTHAFCEHAINELLVAKKMPKTQNKYIKSQSAFVVRLDLCYNMGLIPEKLFDNLIKLNDLRNKCAHNIDVDFSKIDHNYHLVDSIFNVEKEENINKKLLNIAINTLGVLNNHAISLGVKL